MRETRRYDPLRVAKRKADSNSGGWDQTLVRFRGHFDTVYNVHNGQPSGWLLPETALARISKFVKEDLKRSVSAFYCVFVHRFTNLLTWQQPLQSKKAGEGKRSRDVETYLEALLQAIRQTDPALLPTQGGLEGGGTIVANLSWREYPFVSTRGETN